MSKFPNIAVILTDADRYIQWVNHDFTAITGYSISDVIGKKPSLLQGPASSPAAIKRFRNALDKGISFKDEIINYRKNGQQYLCRLVVHPIFNRKKELTNYIAFEVDGNCTDDSFLPIMQLAETDSIYQNVSLQQLKLSKIYERLRYYMEEEKAYLNPKIKLKEIADHLHTNTKYLSQVINLLTGANTNKFINSYRIRDAKIKLLAPEAQQLTLYGVARQCGFKNKSTFYKVFKEITGLTPKEYVKKHQNQS